MASSEPPQHVQAPITAPLPRITIQFCTQCKWMLRAAYYAQELLSTFSLSIGEVALQPSTGGTFIVTIHHSSTTTSSPASPSPVVQSTTLWDRKTDGGFPETKDLKRRVRDVIEPGRNLGHVDRHHHRPSPSDSTAAAAGAAANSAPAAASDDVRDATQEAAAPTSSSSSSSAVTATAANEGNDARGDKDAQKQASAGIVCEDCT